MSSIQTMDSLDFINIYGSSLLVFFCFMLAMFLLRKVLQLPARVDLYVLLVCLISANLVRLEYYTDIAVRKFTNFIEPGYGYNNKRH